MRRLLPLKLALIPLLFAACVTVNVYFPAAAAEQAADKIIDTVTGQSGVAQPQNGSQKPAPTSKVLPLEEAPGGSVREKEDGVLLIAAGRVLQWLIPTAQAQGGANLDISTPEIRAVTASMKGRFEQLEKYFASGAVGLTEEGLIEIRDQNAVPLAERATVKRLVAEDNRDRATLYAEIAKANGHPEWEPQIRKTFARRWVERGAQPGWYYQDGGSWKQK